MFDLVRNSASIGSRFRLLIVSVATLVSICACNEKAQPSAVYGYYFRRLDSQGSAAKGGARTYVGNGKATGGFAYVAYPAKYNDSGVQTFIINQGRVIYGKNLGKDTANLAKAMSEFNPDNTWTALQ
jgi:hypothetical protein